MRDILTFIFQWNVANRETLLAEIYANRWKNLFGVTVYIGIVAIFVLLGYRLKRGWFTPVHRYIYLAFAWLLLAFGVVTWIQYVVIIVRGHV